METASAPEVRHQRTGLAIVAAVLATVAFYLAYRLLFGLVVQAFGAYQRSFSYGIGALVLLALGPNVLGSLSGTVTARWLFPRASTEGLFYAIATLLVITAGLSVFREISSRDGHWTFAAMNIGIVALSMVAVRIACSYELPTRTRD